jgi:hypothetical protein
MSKEKSLRRERPPLANQLTLAAGLYAALVLGAPRAIAQADQSVAATVTIFSNLGPSSTNLYFTGASFETALGGFCIVGAEGADPDACGRKVSETWLALPFTPKQNSHATVLQAAIGLLVGTNQFKLALFSDDKGTPGTALATVTVTDAPPAHTCCELVTGKLATPGIALKANTQYWLVAITDDVNAPSFEGLWAFTNFAFVAVHDFSAVDGEVSWGTFQNGGALAGAVKGTVP